MAASINDKFRKGAAAFSTTLASQKAQGASSMSLSDATGVPTTTALDFTVGRVDSSGNRTPNSKAVYKGTLSGTTVSNLTLVEGTDQLHAAGTPVEITFTAQTHNDMVDGILVEHNQNGTHGAVTATSLSATSVTATTGTFTNLTVSGTAATQGWSALGQTPNTVTSNGNRSYDLVFNSVDLSSTLSPGMRLQLTRTVTAPTQCADLESSSSHYFNKTSPAGTTFTDDFVAGAWVKLESYPVTQSTIVSRYNGTSGWELYIDPSGRVLMIGRNAGAANNSYVQSVQSIPLGKWVHVAAQLDMSAFTATTTTSYIMFDGVDVPASVSRGGTNPTALVQAGNLEVGSSNATYYFDGKLAQVFYSSAKITQANVRTLIGQGLTASLISTHSIVSAYSLSNSINDLNTTSANNLTAQNSAVATNSDSPYALSAAGVPTGTTEYAIVTSVTYSTNTTVTVQTPEGGALPTSGGISSILYSTHEAPYGFIRARSKWDVELVVLSIVSSSGTASSTVYNPGGLNLNIPVGSWRVRAEYQIQVTTAADVVGFRSSLSTSASAFDQASRFNTRVLIPVSGSSAWLFTTTKTAPVTTTVATPYYILLYNGNSFSVLQVRGDTGLPGEITSVVAECAFV